MSKKQKNKKQIKPAKANKTTAKGKSSVRASGKIKKKNVKPSALKPAKLVRSANKKVVVKKSAVKLKKKETPKKGKKTTVKSPVVQKKKASQPVKKVLKKIAKPSVATKKGVKSVVKKGPAVKQLKKKQVPVAITKTKPKKQVLVKKKPASKESSKPSVTKIVKKPVDAIALPKTKPEKVRKGKGGRKPKKKEGEEDEPEIGDDAFIEEIIKSVKPSKNTSKQPKIIKTFINPMTSLIPVDLGKKGSIPKKEPKGKFELEYVVRTSAGILYEFLSSPSGLSEWFADDVNIRDGIFTFFWDGSEQKAKLLALKEEKFIRFSWVDKPDGYYFEFRIERDELTGDISLLIVDFADEASDEQTSKRLWDTQVNKLLHVIGSF